MTQRVQRTLGKTKLVPRDLGNPNVVLAKPEGDLSPYPIGIIYGRAVKIGESVAREKNGDMKVLPKLLGNFVGIRAVPLDAKDGTEITEIRASVLHLPTGIMELFTVPLAEKDASPIDFAIKLSVRKASNSYNTDTYEWLFEDLYARGAAGVTDPLQHLRDAVDAARRGLLTAPEDTYDPETGEIIEAA